MHHWSTSDVLAVFLVLLFVVALVIILSVVTKRDSELECDRANTVRGNLLALLAIAAGVLVLVSQRFELQSAVKSLM